MRDLYLHPTAAYIINHGATARPVATTARERKCLRELAAQVAEVAALPRQRRTERLWTEHNRLVKTRPIFAVYPEVGWADLVPSSALTIETPFWRNQEWYLRHLLYRIRFLRDDFVIKPEIVSAIDYRVEHADLGFPAVFDSVAETSAYVARPAISDYGQIANFRMPELVVEPGHTEERYARLREVYDGLLDVRKKWCCYFSVHQPDEAGRLRGIQQLMLDMYDNPNWLHELMELLTQAHIKLYREMEATGLLTPNTGNDYVSPGGMGFTDEFPAKEGGCRLSELWVHGVAQSYSELSPEMHEEYGIRYQARVMELFGLSAYGCCEPYTRKFDILRAIPHLRSVSVSPWCDLGVAADRLKDKTILSWKPNPSVVLLEKDFERVKRYLRDGLHAARNCVLEVFLKDIVRLEPWQCRRLTEYCDFMRSALGD
ncbi:MAG: hypothetical protein PHR35_08850 [Kiritimatiellae bacterium]|nr:hypothetical protein [Kiritimatiellia bacterium]